MNSAFTHPYVDQNHFFKCEDAESHARFYDVSVAIGCISHVQSQRNVF